MSYFEDKQYYGLGGQDLSQEDIDSGMSFAEQLNKDEEERKRIAEEQARIEALNNRPISQKVWEYIKDQANYAKDNPVQAAQNVGMGIIATEKRVGDIISAPITAGIYNKVNEENMKKSQEMDAKILNAIRNTTDPEKKKKLLGILNQKTEQIDVLKEVPSLNKTPGQIYADFAMLGVDIFGATTLVGGVAKNASGQLVKSGVKGFMANVGVDAVKEGGWKVAQKAVGEEAAKKLATKAFFKTVVEGAGWGAAYGGEGTYSEGGSWEEIKKATEMGAMVGGGLAIAGHGVVSGIKWAKERPMNKIRAQVTNDFEQHLITGVKDHNIATELLDNGAKSVKASASLPESLDHLGVDLMKKETLMATEEGQRAIAGTTVAEKMSKNAKKAIYNEIVGSGLFKVEKGDSIDDVVQKGVESILSDGNNVRSQLNLTSKYTDSVLGVINPKLAEVESMVAGKVAEGVTPPVEAPVTPAETLNVPVKESPTERPKSFTIPEDQTALMKQRDDAKKMYQSIGITDATGVQKENAGLRILEDQFATPQGKAQAVHEVNEAIATSKIIPNEDGTVTVYRGGTPSEANNLVSVSTDKAAAEAFGPVKEFKVKLDDIASARGLDPNELLVTKQSITPETSVKTPTKPIEEVTPKTDTETPVTPKKEELFAETTGQPRKIPDKIFETEKAAVLYDELANAQAGFRKRGAEIQGEGNKFETVSQKSTFPEWVPEKYTKDNGKVVNLRDRKLFDKVQSHILSGTVPTDEVELALYDIIHNELRTRLDMPTLEFPTEGKIVKSQRSSPEKPVKSTSGERADNEFSKRYNEMYHPGAKLTTHEIAHNDEQITRALDITRTDYKRAIRIATGLEKSEETLTNATAMAVLEKARFEGDVALEHAVLDATDKRASRGGQELQILSKMKSVDPAYDAVREVTATQNKAFEAKTKTKPDVAIEKTTKEIDSHIQEITGDKFAKFINDHPC